MKETMTNENESNYGLGMSAPADSHQTSSDIILLNFFRRFGIATGVSAIAVTKVPERIPDITFCRLGTDLNDIDKQEDIVMTVELVRDNRNYKASLDSIITTFGLIPSLEEAFLYSFREGTWTRVSRTNDIKGWREDKNNDYSQTFGIHMNTLVKESREREDEHDDLTYSIRKNCDSSFIGKKIRSGVQICEKPAIAPDLTIYEDGNRKPILAIKVTHYHLDVKLATMCAEETLLQVQSLKEYFILDMRTEQWTRVTKEDGYITTEKDKDYSRVLKKYMHTLMR